MDADIVAEMIAELQEIESGWAIRERKSRYELTPWEKERLEYVRRILARISKKAVDNENSHQK